MRNNGIFFSIFLLLAGFIATGCSCDFGEIGEASKNYVTRTYKVSDFNRIDISTIADVYYTQSPDGTTAVEVYGPDNVVSLINASIKNNTLYLSTGKKSRFKKVKNKKITISSPELYSVKFTGVGNVYIENGIKSPSLELKNQGVGDFRVKGLECDELTIVSTGVGNVSLEGSAANASLVSEGVGNIDADELKSENVRASAHGVGNISCHAVVSIYARAGGVGNITYSGSPEKKDLKKNGIGSIKSK